VSINAKTGDIFTVVIDMDNKKTCLLKNDMMIGDVQDFGYGDKDIGNLYPCIDMWKKGDKITIL
jgi:hypothetical protein